YRDFLDTNTDLYSASYPWMVNRGLFMTPGDEEQWTLSVQHTEADIDRYVEAFTELCAALAWSTAAAASASCRRRCAGLRATRWGRRSPTAPLRGWPAAAAQ